MVGYQIARQGIRPVEEMAATARRINSTHLGERILTEGYPFELAPLAGTFNQMLDRLEDSFDRISKFSADIAHDLRTPVNNFRGEAEVALARARTIDEHRKALESSLEKAVRLSDLIGDLLFLARTENPLMHLRRAPVDVAELLDGVQEYYEASAADGGISLITRFGDEPVIAELDRTLMQRTVGNLVSNAVAHTPSGGSVVMATSSESAVVRIEVADTGIGIPPEALPRVFDRSSVWIHHVHKPRAARASLRICAINSRKQRRAQLKFVLRNSAGVGNSTRRSGTALVSYVSHSTSKRAL